ncbi:hypothetical protein MNBD_GAMMA12-2490 [hydrothermal vent metagenome]|uniref:MobA-like NTP transferase domain-containing protein n=1 Tax=hydrothermal vent metagenome TaxID=652676 RepID=A0A3B0Z225_9ZZZZ
MTSSSDISALILAGGKASRFNGQDKGLVELQGSTMITQVIQALKPQVNTILISANRNVESYKTYGYPVVRDQLFDLDKLQGPLAGILQGMRKATTPWLLLSPCDTPFIQANYCQKMIAALNSHTNKIAVAVHQGKLQPLFSLMPITFQQSLEKSLNDKNYKVGQWIKSMPHIEVDFLASKMFTNINTPDELTLATDINKNS